jgi:hypothetical protein
MKGEVQNAKEFRDAGMLPTPKNTAADETQLPPWVREVRQIERAKKMAEKIQGKPNG